MKSQYIKLFPKKVLTLLSLLPLLLAAQQETEAHKKVSQQFEEYYNKDDFLNIFELYSDVMKKALPWDKSTAFFSSLKLQVGKIEKREFKRFQNATYAVYKTTFERGVFALNVSLDSSGEINGLFVKPYIEETFPIVNRNTTTLILPFNEEWTVFWGGDTREQNYHIDYPAQKGAFDLVITDKNGKSFKGSGGENTDYYAFGKEIIAPCEGEVVLAVDGIKDNNPGEINPAYVPGNTVILKTSNNEFLFFAHFMKNSIAVKEGDQIKQGELLGLCGNSGNSSEPHLHFHLQNIEDFNKATGGKTYFDEIVVDGEIKKDYSPVKGERIKNTNQ